MAGRPHCACVQGDRLGCEVGEVCSAPTAPCIAMGGVWCAVGSQCPFEREGSQGQDCCTAGRLARQARRQAATVLALNMCAYSRLPLLH